MGRIMSFDQDGCMVRDFDKSEYDFLRRYGRTPDEVMAENARLREVVSDGEESARLILAESRALQAENAKLRELVKEMHALATDHGVYVRYPYCDAWDEKLAVVEKQMRDLGIEV